MKSTIQFYVLFNYEATFDSLICLSISKAIGNSSPLSKTLSQVILAVLLVPLKAAPCFHILSAAVLQSAVVGEAAQHVQSVCLPSNDISAHCTCYYSFLSV